MTRFSALKTIGVVALAFAFWILPTRAMAAPVACGGGVDVTTYTDGCFIDGLFFSEFAVLNAGSDTVEVDTVLAQVVGTVVYFTFNPNLTGDDLDDILFLFKVSTLDGSASISGVDLFNGGQGDTSIQETLCAVSWLPTLQCSSFIGSGMVAGSGEFDDDFFAPVSAAYVLKDINKNGEDERSHLTFFTQSFHTVPDGGSTLALLGFGLIGLRALRRSFARR